MDYRQQPRRETGMVQGIISEERSSYVTSGRQEDEATGVQQPGLSPEEKHAPKALGSQLGSDEEKEDQ